MLTKRKWALGEEDDEEKQDNEEEERNKGEIDTVSNDDMEHSVIVVAPRR